MSDHFVDLCLSLGRLSFDYADPTIDLGYTDQTSYGFRIELAPAFEEQLVLLNLTVTPTMSFDLSGIDIGLYSVRDSALTGSIDLLDYDQLRMVTDLSGKVTWQCCLLVTADGGYHFTADYSHLLEAKLPRVLTFHARDWPELQVVSEMISQDTSTKPGAERQSH